MSEDLSAFSSPELKDIVQDMRDLLSQSRLSFLFGAGCSLEAGLPLMSDLTEQVLGFQGINKGTKQLLNRIRKQFSSESVATIEDYMSEVIDCLSIAERRTQCKAAACNVLIDDKEYTADELQEALNEIKEGVASCISEKEVDVSNHQRFIRAIHHSLQAGKPFRTVDYFILNYDTLVEDALGLEKVGYVDGFTGGATAWWDPSSFQTDIVAARVFKIHGSIDWRLLKGDSLPRRIRAGIATDADSSHVLIYPAATKYQEAQRDPFAQLLQHMRKSLCPTEGREMVLVVCGYNFRDAHINTEIKNALNKSDGRLTLAAFVGQDKPQEELNMWINDSNISEQVRVYMNSGFYHSETNVSAKDVPWWKFEILARLLGGER